MAHYRKIDTHIWNDAKFIDLPNESKMMFIYLLTHPNMTSLGAIRSLPESLSVELNLEIEKGREAFAELLARGMVECDRKACLIALPNFLKYNKPESPNVVKSWIKGADFIPECDLKIVVLQRAESIVEELGKGFAEAFKKAFGKPSLKAIEKTSPNQRTENREQILEDIHSDKSSCISSSADDEKKPNPVDEIYNAETLAFLRRGSRETDYSIRGIVGDWLKSHPPEAIKSAITSAKVATANRPVSYVAKILDRAKAGNAWQGNVPDESLEPWARQGMTREEWEAA